MLNGFQRIRGFTSMPMRYINQLFTYLLTDQLYHRLLAVPWSHVFLGKAVRYYTSPEADKWRSYRTNMELP